MSKHARTMHHKVSSAFIVFFTLFTLGVVGLVQYSYQRQLSAQYLQQYQYESALTATQMDAMLTTTQARCNNIIITVNNLIDFSDVEMQLVTRLSSMRAIFTTNLFAEENIEEMRVVFSSGETHTKDSDGSYQYDENGLCLVDYLDALNVTTQGQYFYLSPSNPNTVTLHDTLDSGIYYAKMLCDLETLAPVGYVVLKLDEQALYMVYAEQAQSEHVTYYLLNPQGLIVSTDDANLDIPFLNTVSTATFLNTLFTDASDNVVTRTALSQDWVMVSCYDLNADLQGDYRQLYSIITLAVLVLVMLYLVIIRISRRLTAPLAELTNHMNHLTPELPKQIVTQSSSLEVESLTNSFNIMVAHYHTLFADMQREQEAKSLLEMQLLQTQIKPHFLYNTLGTAHCLNLAGNAKQSDNLIKALVSYYRIVLSNGADWIPLNKEFEAVERYLEIMAMRYQSFLHYEIHLPPELAAYTIPKLTLQPLVENAIDHGIKPLRKQSKISVWAEDDGDFISIHIYDDGIGMDAETFSTFIHGEKPSQDEGGFGLKNVADRVNSYYKGGGKLMLQPSETGTNLMVCIPKEQEQTR